MVGVTRKGRRLVASNSKWHIYSDHLTDGHGNEVPDYLVVAPIVRRSDGVTGVTVLPILDGRFVLIRSYRHATGTHCWEAPRGFLDAAESESEAALRELTEETGLTSEAADLIALGAFAPEGSTIAGRAAVFVAPRCRGVPRLPADEIGIDEIASFSADEMARLAAERQIDDGGTLIAYYQYCAMLARP